MEKSEKSLTDQNGLETKHGITNNGFINDENGQLQQQMDENNVKLMTDGQIKAEKRKIFKNILLISLAFLFNFNAFQGLSRLQSSLHRDEGMGTANSAVLYAALMLSSLITPKIMINYIGYKWSIPLSTSGYILWMAANGYAVWGTMVTASILVGLCAAPLWTAQKSYFTIIARRYATLTQEDADAMVARFLGIFYGIFQLCKCLKVKILRLYSLSYFSSVSA